MVKGSNEAILVELPPSDCVDERQYEKPNTGVFLGKLEIAQQMAHNDGKVTSLTA